MSHTQTTGLYLIIGDPVSHSLSPQMHTAALQSLHIDNKYKHETRLVKADELPGFINEMRSTGMRGASCTIPHKVAVMQHLDEIDPIAARIGAVNTVVNDNGVLKGYNTDWIGIVAPLEKLTQLSGKRAAILGAGGAARAITYGLTSKGAEVAIYNRTLEKSQKLAEDFDNTTAYSLEDPEALEAIKNADIIINATPVGMQPNDGQAALAQEFITDSQIVFDAVYRPYDTLLLHEAKQQGAQVIHGTEMLLYQGMAQFKLYTGYDAPEAVMRDALHQALGIDGDT